MKKVLILVLVVWGVSFSACKTSKARKKNEAENKTTESVIVQPVVNKDTIVKKDNGPRYELIVSFVSIGSGIDSKSVKTLDDFIVNFQKDKNVTVTYEINAWGREGETDYCFSLATLPKEAKEKFTSSVKKLFSNTQLIRVSENDYFTHKRR